MTEETTCMGEGATRENVSGQYCSGAGPPAGPRRGGRSRQPRRQTLQANPAGGAAGGSEKKQLQRQGKPPCKPPCIALPTHHEAHRGHAKQRGQRLLALGRVQEEDACAPQLQRGWSLGGGAARARGSDRGARRAGAAAGVLGCGGQGALNLEQKEAGAAWACTCGADDSVHAHADPEGACREAARGGRGGRGMARAG